MNQPVIVKKGSFQIIMELGEDNGDTCTLVGVPNCEGVCDSTHRYITLKLDTDVYIHVYSMYRYDAVKDAPGMNPTSIETHQCLLEHWHYNCNYFM